MTYSTGEEVYLGDAVHYLLGDLLLLAKVVAVARDGASLPGYEWFSSKSPNGILIEWSQSTEAAHFLWPSNSQSMAPILETTEDDEDLHFASRAE